MAGIQIDGVNNKIDFDDDLDTSISANVDDTLQVEVGGNTMATITATAFNINDGTTITTDDNTYTLTLKSTDADANQGPLLSLHRDSGSPADNDTIGGIQFRFEDDAGNVTTGHNSLAQIVDASNGSEDCTLIEALMIGGSAVETVRYTAAGTIFNEQSNDLDFRVESNGNANMLFVNGGNNRVGIGSGSPESVLHVEEGTSPKITVRSADGTSASIKLQRINENDASTDFELKNDGGIFKIISDNSSINERPLVNFESAQVTFNEDSQDIDFRVESNGLTHALFVDAGNDKVGIGTASPDYIFQVEQTDEVYSTALRNRHASNPYGLFLKYTSAGPDGAGNHFLFCQDNGITRMQVASDGDVTNHDNAYGAISDERIKQDIRDSNSQWNDIKAVKVRNYKKKDDVRQYGDDAWEQIGVVAQELEAVSPKLIKHNDPNPSDILSSSAFGTLYEDGDDIPEDKEIGDVKTITEQVKSVNYSILYMKAIKALQEAQTRIETLETKVAALEG